MPAPLHRVRRRVESVAPAGKELVFTDGSRLRYDKLLLAVGSKGRPAPWPGSEGPGVHAFVTLRDLEGLDRDARKGGRAVVVGGGLIGVEAAEILHDRCLHVTFVIRENWYFPLALDENEALLVTEHMREHGIDVRFGVNVKDIVRGEGGGCARAPERRPVRRGVHASLPRALGREPSLRRSPCKPA